MAKDFTLGGRDCICDHTIARDITLVIIQNCLVRGFGSAGLPWRQSLKNLPLDFVSPSKPLQIVQESAARLRQCPVTTLQVCQNAAHFLPLGIEEVGLRDVP